MKTITRLRKTLGKAYSSQTVRGVLVLLVVLTLFFGADVFASALQHVAQAQEDVAEALADAQEQQEILWLARALYSESKRAEEQTLVAWVIRNRVESDSFPDTYESVVRQRSQFSGLSPRDKQYHINVSLGYEHSGRGWDSALAVAEGVYHAHPRLRPIGKTVWHFYSPIAVRRTPSWAKEANIVHTVHDTDDHESVRFAFYADVH